jgi:hypothetical protein
VAGIGPVGAGRTSTASDDLHYMEYLERAMSQGFLVQGTSLSSAGGLTNPREDLLISVGFRNNSVIHILCTQSTIIPPPLSLFFVSAQSSILL